MNKESTNPIADLLPTCKKNTVKELLTSMSADTYIWLRDTVVQGREVTSLTHSLEEKANHNGTDLSSITLKVHATGKGWECIDDYEFIFKTKLVDIKTCKKVVEDMVNYYCKEILGIEV